MKICHIYLFNALSLYVSFTDSPTLLDGLNQSRILDESGQTCGNHGRLYLSPNRNKVISDRETAFTPKEFASIGSRRHQQLNNHSFTAVPYIERWHPLENVQLSCYSPKTPAYRPYRQFVHDLHSDQSPASLCPLSKPTNHRTMTTPRIPPADDNDDDDETYGFSKLHITQSADNLCDQLEQDINQLAAADATHSRTLPKKSKKLTSTFLTSRMKLVSLRTQKLFQRIYHPLSSERHRPHRPQISSPILLHDPQFPPEWDLMPAAVAARSRRSLSYGHLPGPEAEQGIHQACKTLKDTFGDEPEKKLELVDDTDSGIVVNESGQSSMVIDTATPMKDSLSTHPEATLKYIQLEIEDSMVDRNLGISVAAKRSLSTGYEITEIVPGGLVDKDGTISLGDELVSFMGEPVCGLTLLEVQDRILKSYDVTVVDVTVARKSTWIDRCRVTSGSRRHITFAESSPNDLKR